jgi:aldehyde dehydrogenase (NAD+)
MIITSIKKEETKIWSKIRRILNSPKEEMKLQNIRSIIERQREFFVEDKTKDIVFRLEHLKRLGISIKNHEQEILQALKKDLNKAPFEAYATEVGMVLEELNFIRKRLTGWAVPKRVRTSITNFISTSTIYSEPYGVVLIMSPWNYPFMLTIAPLIGAIAAGNCAIVKPSNYSPNTSEVIDIILSEVFRKDYVTVVHGGREANQSLLEQKFDYIFFTGSVAVGKLVMEAAAKYITPITLELGGKSPCIVDETADLDLAARRITWGKFMNAGQTCVAPDYLLVHYSVKDELLHKIKEYIVKFYGSNVSENENFPKIVNEKHLQRLIDLMDGEQIEIGGDVSRETNQIAPTVLDHINWDSPIMVEEIFGPLLPILEYKDLNDVISRINNRPKPLALYFFTKNKPNERKIIQSISYGGGCINDTIMHLTSSNMPFGGVGESGMGGYHGSASFDTFSHKKSILKKSNWFDLPLRYPPYKDHLALIKKIMK